MAPVSYLMSHASCLLSHVSCLTSLVSRLLPHVSCLRSLVSRLLPHVSCLTSPIWSLLSHVSCLISPVTCLLSHVSRLLYYSELVAQLVGGVQVLGRLHNSTTDRSNNRILPGCRSSFCRFCCIRNSIQYNIKRSYVLNLTVVEKAKRSP